MKNYKVMIKILNVNVVYYLLVGQRQQNMQASGLLKVILE